MTVLALTLLFIWALLATAIAITYWRAWREALDGIEAAYEFAVLDDLVEGHVDDDWHPHVGAHTRPSPQRLNEDMKRATTQSGDRHTAGRGDRAGENGGGFEE